MVTYHFFFHAQVVAIKTDEKKKLMVTHELRVEVSKETVALHWWG